MKCFLLTLLALGILVEFSVGLDCVCAIPKYGKPCRNNGKFVKHRDYAIKFSRGAGKICNNGDLMTLQTPVGYKPGPECEEWCPCRKTCKAGGQMLCEGMDVEPKPKARTMRRQCFKGKTFLVNNFTGKRVVSN